MSEWKNGQMMFGRKDYGRIFVEKEEDVQKVEDIMKEIDPHEFNWYYPTGDYMGGNHERLVTVFSEKNYKSIYVGKFDDMDISKVLKKAWEQGIHCFAVFGKCNQYDNI